MAIELVNETKLPRREDWDPPWWWSALAGGVLFGGFFAGVSHGVFWEVVLATPGLAAFALLHGDDQEYRPGRPGDPLIPRRRVRLRRDDAAWSRAWQRAVKVTVAALAFAATGHILDTVLG